MDLNLRYGGYTTLLWSVNSASPVTQFKPEYLGSIKILV